MGVQALEKFSHRRVDRENGFRDSLDRDLGGTKMKILVFQNKNNLKAYLEWEKKVKLIFYHHHYYEVKKIKLISIEFIEYVIIWWDQLVLGRRGNEERLIDT
jgi:hypothetical protein